MAFEAPTCTPGQPAAYRENSRFLSCIGLWPGQTAPTGIRVIAVRTTAGSPPLVVRSRHLTDSVAPRATRGHSKTGAMGTPWATVRGLSPVCPLDLRLFAPRFRQHVGTLLTHGKAGVCARLSITDKRPSRYTQSKWRADQARTTQAARTVSAPSAVEATAWTRSRSSSE